MAGDDRVPLAAMICGLRSELEEAASAGEDADLVFGLGPIELELETAVTRDGGIEAGIKFWVLTLGGRAGKATERTQRVKLVLSPRHRDRPDEDVFVRDHGVLGD
jgi:hypothetical protein